MKYGYSQAFSFIHRKIRISELIEDVINSGKKITVDDMKDITFDILDVQMRESLYSMLHVAKHGTKGLYNFDQDKTKKRVNQAIDILKDWDYRYDKNKPQGAVMEAWEFAISTYMHETKIGDVRLRRGIHDYPSASNFLFNQIAKWAKEDATYEEYCYVYDLAAKNNC